MLISPRKGDNPTRTPSLFWNALDHDRLVRLSVEAAADGVEDELDRPEARVLDPVQARSERLRPVASSEDERVVARALGPNRTR
jgi:hypothetical protein